MTSCTQHVLLPSLCYDIYTGWGCLSVAMFCFAFVLKFRFPVGQGRICSSRGNFSKQLNKIRRHLGSPALYRRCRPCPKRVLDICCSLPSPWSPLALSVFRPIDHLSSMYHKRSEGGPPLLPLIPKRIERKPFHKSENVGAFQRSNHYRNHPCRMQRLLWLLTSK